MRSHSARALAALLLASALASLAVGAVLGTALERRREQQTFLVGDALARHGADAATALGAGSRERAEEILARLEARTGLGVAIVDPSGAVIAGRADAPHGAEIVEATRGSVEAISATFEGRRWHAVGLPGGLIAVGAPIAPRAALGLSPATLQLALACVLSVIVCLLLARWLSAPIRALRAAADRMDAGPPGVRVVPTMPRTADADVMTLAHDLDRMAERTEAVIESRERMLRSRARRRWSSAARRSRGTHRC